MAGLHSLQPEGVAEAFGKVGAVEGFREVVEELGAVGVDLGANVVEGGQGQAVPQERGDGTDEDSLGDAFGAVVADVAGDFAAAGGVADEDGVVEVEVVDEAGEVVGIGVHVVAQPRLRGAAVAAAIVGNAAESIVGKELHLVVPGVGGEGPAVAEDDGLTGAPVFVVKAGAVLCSVGRHAVWGACDGPSACRGERV